MFPGGSDSKEVTRNAGELSSIPGSGRYLGEGNDNPLQYSCLQNSMDRGAWQATIRGHKELDTTERLTLITHLLKYLIILHFPKLSSIFSCMVGWFE